MADYVNKRRRWRESRSCAFVLSLRRRRRRRRHRRRRLSINGKGPLEFVYYREESFEPSHRVLCVQAGKEGGREMECVCVCVYRRRRRVGLLVVVNRSAANINSRDNKTKTFLLIHPPLSTLFFSLSPDRRRRRRCAVD